MLSTTCLRPFNFTIILHDHKKDENKVIRNSGIQASSVTFPYAKVNTTKTKQCSI